MAGTTELGRFLERLSWSPERLAREVNRLCGPGTVSAKAPYHWLRGAYPRRDVPEAVARVLARHLGEPVDVEAIWPPDDVPAAAEPMAPVRSVLPRSTPSEVTRLVTDSCSSARLVQQVSETNADDTTLDQLHHELAGLTGSYLHVPPGSLVYRAVMLRDRVARLLAGHQRPQQRRTLLALGAKYCTMLAWMAEDLGDGHAAYNHAAAAWELADLADDDGARRWVRVTQSRQSYWARNYVESAQLATDGLGHRADDGLDVLLELVAARAWAASGNSRDARRVLREWSARTPSGPAADTGLLSLRGDREAYLAGHTMLLLDDPERACGQLRTALDGVRSLPAAERFYGSEMLTRIDLVRAAARLGELDDAVDELEPVFGLEPEKVINMVVLSLRAASAELLDLSGSVSTARDVSRRIGDFLGEPAPAVPVAARRAG